MIKHLLRLPSGSSELRGLHTVRYGLHLRHIFARTLNMILKVRNLRCLRRRQGRWGVQRGAMQCSPPVTVRAAFPRRRHHLRRQSRPLAAELLKVLVLTKLLRNLRY